MMSDDVYLIQLLLPVYDAAGAPFPRRLYDEFARELTHHFGGVTAYIRAPAAGFWEEKSGRTVRDEVVVYEVMTDELDSAWWNALRRRLEAQFEQDELVVRAQLIRRL
jgi:hypothetical protein